MASEEQKLLVLVEARVDGLEKQLRKANDGARRQFRDIGDSAGNARRRIENETRAAGDAAIKNLATIDTATTRSNAKLAQLSRGVTAASESWKAGLAGFAAGAISQISVATVTASVAELAKLNDVAERTGASSAFLQEFGFAVRQSGGETEDAAAGIQKFSVNISKAAKDGGELAKVFEANGVALRDTAGKLRPIEALLADYADLIKNTESEQDRLNLATMAFGKSAGPALVLALAEGKQGLAEIAREANAAGVVLGDDLVKQAAKLDDQFAKVTDRMNGVSKKLAVEFGGPVVAAGMEILLGYLRAVKQTIEDIRNLRLADLIVRPEIRNFISPPVVDQGADKAELEKQAADVRTEITNIEAQKLAPDVAGARIGNLKKDLAEIEAQIKTINATPIAPDYSPSRIGLTAGGDRPTIIPSETGSGGASPFASGDAVAQFVRQVIKAESGGRADAKNPNSSATGAGQFIESTWLALFRKHYPEQARGMGESAILELRKDADISKKLIESYAAENATVLRSAGVAVTSASLHLGHFLGAGDAVKVMKAAPGTPLRGLISSASIAANPTVLGGGRTVDDARAYADRRANTTRLASGDRTDAEQEAEKQATAIKKVIEALGLEVDQLGRTEQQQRVLQELQKAGVDLNSAEGQAIRAKVAALFELKTAQAGVEQSAEAAKRTRETFADLGADATTGIISDLRNGVSAAQAFGNALDRIADQLIDMAVKQLFANAFSGGTTGGAGGGILGFIGKAFGFSDGGWTGPGDKYQPAGVVHADEFVFSKEATRRIGVDNLERLHRGTKGYADGGLVGGSRFQPKAIPALPKLALPKAPAMVAGGASTVSQNITISTPITVNASGGSPEQNQDLAQRVAKQAEGSIRGIVGDELRIALRAGNVLNRGR